MMSNVLFFLIVQYVHSLQRKYALSSFSLLGHTAPVQAGSLLILGPFLDFWLTNQRVDKYDYNVTSVVSSERLHYSHFLFSINEWILFMTNFHRHSLMCICFLFCSSSSYYHASLLSEPTLANSSASADSQPFLSKSSVT